MKKKKEKKSTVMLMIHLTSLIGFTTADQWIRFQFQVPDCHDRKDKK